jgi:hypothetical protein
MHRASESFVRNRCRNNGGGQLLCGCNCWPARSRTTGGRDQTGQEQAKQRTAFHRPESTRLGEENQAANTPAAAIGGSSWNPGPRAAMWPRQNARSQF